MSKCLKHVSAPHIRDYHTKENVASKPTEGAFIAV